MTGNRKPKTINRQPTTVNRQPKTVAATDGSSIRAFQPDLRFKFSPEQPQAEVARVIGLHPGAERAITIEGIAQELWYMEWLVMHNDSTGHPLYPYRKKIQRAVKQCVRNLRRQGMKIASDRGSRGNPGYYMITNSKELAATVRPMLRQAVDELRTIEALTGKGYYSAELAGQEKLFGAGVGD